MKNLTVLLGLTAILFSPVTLAEANATTPAQMGEVIDEKIYQAVTEQVVERMAAVSWAGAVPPRTSALISPTSTGRA